MATLFKDNNGNLEFKDAGSRSEAIKWTKDGKIDSVVSNKPTVGCSILVGSVTARSYSSQDYWLTTEILEILEETDEKIRFRTENSIYEWWI